MTGITTHVLDAATGRPAAGIRVDLLRHSDDGWSLVGAATTDAGGRVRDFGRPVDPGLHRLVFEVGAYFADRGARPFYPEVVVAFNAEGPCHVPLLLSPFAYSTYRGS